MWISRRKWKELEARVECLEAENRQLWRVKAPYDVVFFLHTHLNTGWDRETRVPIHELVRALMRYVGVTVKEVPFRAAGYEMVPNETPTPTKD